MRKIIGTKDLFAAPVPPTLVDGLITRYGVTGLSADPGVGKTFLAIEIARCVVTGDALFERFKTKRGSVLFVGQDCSLLQYAQQARKVLARDLEREIRIPIGDDEYVFQKPLNHIHWLIHAGLDLKATKDVAALIDIANSPDNPTFDPDSPIDYETEVVEDENGRRIEYTPIYDRSRGVSLIILDTWAFFHSANENDNSEMTRVFQSLRLIAEKTQAAVLVLHHHSYSSEYNAGNRWRGASSQPGALDGHFELSGHDDKKKLKVRKYRGIQPKDFTFKMFTSETLCNFEFGEEVVNKQVEAVTRKQSLLDDIRTFIEAMPEQHEFTTREAANFLSAERGYGEASASSNASTSLSTLCDEQSITRLKPGTWRTL